MFRKLFRRQYASEKRSNGTCHRKTTRSLLFRTKLPGLGNRTGHVFLLIRLQREFLNFAGAYCFILLGSLFENFLIIIILYKHQDLRKTIDHFTVTLAVSDLLLSQVFLPDQITKLVTASLHWRVSGILGSRYFACCFISQA